jgi:hypothetical protein
MPTGLFKTPDQSAQIEYDGVSIPIPKVDIREERLQTPPSNRSRDRGETTLVPARRGGPPGEP